ncbi:MAG: dienelactone hydrolase family protein [Actinomycetota bacterium]
MGEVLIPAGAVDVAGDLHVPAGSAGMVVFAHGSGSSRHSPRNRSVATVLQEAGLATLLMDLLTEDEEAADRRTGHLRFDIGLLADRLADAARWLEGRAKTAGLPLGFFGASTGGGAALVAAAAIPHRVSAVVSRGGRPDLAGESLPQVRAPTLLVVGERDTAVIGMNREAMAQMLAPTELVIVPGAGHLFEETGALGQVAALARGWFLRHLRTSEHSIDQE